MAVDKAGIVNAAPRTITREVEGVGQVRFRSAPYKLVMQWMDADDGDAQAIVYCVVDDAGNQLLTAEDVAGLQCPVREALARGSLAANGYGQDAEKN